VRRVDLQVFSAAVVLSLFVCGSVTRSMSATRQYSAVRRADWADRPRRERSRRGWSGRLGVRQAPGGQRTCRPAGPRAPGKRPCFRKAFQKLIKKKVKIMFKFKG